MPSPKLYVLRAYWTEQWNDADEGLMDVCETYADIGFSINRHELEKIAADLVKGQTGKFWSERRAKQLRSLWGGYDDFKDYTFKVEDITSFII